MFTNYKVIKQYSFIVMLVGLFFDISITHADTIKPFASDGCSAFPDGTISQKELWLSCCIEHDIAYWQGGTYEQRLEADRVLSQCVKDIGKPDIARLMLAGVRVGGTPFLPTPFRWGYGWPFIRGYKALNDEEKAATQRLLNTFKNKPK